VQPASECRYARGAAGTCPLRRSAIFLHDSGVARRGASHAVQASWAIELRWRSACAGLATRRRRRSTGCWRRAPLPRARSWNVIESACRNPETLSWENRTLEGAVSHPLGQDASGYIAYTEDGHVFVAVMGPARSPFVAEHLLSGSRRRRPVPPRATSPIFGRYEFRWRHRAPPRGAQLVPDWVGVTQERLMNTGDSVTLSTHALLLQGGQPTAHLLWERV